MHTALILASIVLALCGCLSCHALLRFTWSPATRRAIHVMGLFLPPLLLMLLSIFMAHFLARVCFWTAPPFDVALTEGFIAIGAVGLACALLLNVSRAVLLPVHVRKRAWEAPIWLQTKVTLLASEMRLRNAPGVRVVAAQRPYAFVAGLFRPCVVVSSGLVALLDDEELSAVVCHELLHIQRGDLWWTALCGVLRDFSWFLPITRRLYMSMLQEQELACDDSVQGEPRRLALASALARVWQSGLNSVRTPRGALAFYSSDHSPHLEARVRRLIEKSGADKGQFPYKALLAMVGLLLLFVIAQVSAAAAAMATMGCDMGQLMMQH